MSDYIDRQAAIDAVGDVHPLDYNSQAIAYRLKSLPSADVVPVVRCKDCKHNNSGYCNNYDGFAHFDHFFVQDDDYCSRGEMVDGEQDDGKGND